MKEIKKEVNGSVLDEINFRIVNTIGCGKSDETDEMIFFGKFPDAFVNSLIEYCTNLGYNITANKSDTFDLSREDEMLVVNVSRKERESLAFNLDDADMNESINLVNNIIESSRKNLLEGCRIDESNLDQSVYTSVMDIKVVNGLIEEYGFTYAHTIDSYEFYFYNGDFTVMFDPDDKEFELSYKNKSFGCIVDFSKGYENRIRSLLDVTKIKSDNSESIKNVLKEIYDSDKDQRYVKGITKLMNFVIKMGTSDQLNDIDYMISEFIKLDFDVKMYIGFLTISIVWKYPLKWHPMLIQYGIAAAKNKGYSEKDSLEMIMPFK